MGANSSKKLAAKCSFLSKDEQVIVSNSFRLASKNSDRIKEDELTKLWGSQLDPRLLQYINTYLFGSEESRSQSVDLERFAELFVYCTRGTVDEKLKVILISLGRSESDSTSIPYLLVKEYVESIVSSYTKIQKFRNLKQFKSWQSRGCFISPQNVQRLAESLIHDLVTNANVPRRTLEVWLQGSTVLGQLLIFVFRHLYNISSREKSERSSVSHISSTDVAGTHDGDRDRSLVPFCLGLNLIPSYPSLLDLNQIVFINAHLPQQYQHEWRFLFSSEIHGESFSTLIGRIVNQGPSVLILEDKNGYMFGGFAPSNWSLGPNFFGDDSSFLFTLSPRMRIFISSGYNQHFQYLNLHQQTMPNGLGMGGQHGYCGLWLDEDYGKGHTSKSCTTYKGYSQMSHSKEFQYRHLEVWGLGHPPQAEKEGPTSVLVGNTETKIMLELAGRPLNAVE